MKRIPRIPVVLWWVTAHLCGSPVPVAEGAAAADVVVLPPFIVEGESLDPPWRYARAGRFEILSCCPDRVTRDLIDAVLDAYDLLHVLVPERFLGRPNATEALILFDEYYWPAASREAIAAQLRPTLLVGPPGGGMALRRPEFHRHLRLADADSSTTFILVSRASVELDGWHLAPAPVRELLEQRVPALPTWLMIGFLGLYRELKFEPDSMTLPPLVWPSEDETRKVIPDPTGARALLPLGEIISWPALAGLDDAGKRLAQAELFVRWALAPGQAARQESFWRLVEHATVEPESEAMFEAAFGASTAAITVQLEEFLGTAVRRPARWRDADPKVRPPLELRAASRSEIARLRGDWERLETRYVRRQLPVLESRYYELARHTLLRAYEAGDADANVLAVLGLLECDAGNLGDAKHYLQEAVRLGSPRPQAALELAGLLFDEFRGLSTRAKHALDRGEAGVVLGPLVHACRTAPPLLGVYELAARVWTNCVDAPRPDDLAMLDEGVRLFWREPSFVFQVASIHAAHGTADRAAALAELGLRHAGDKDLRARFVALQEKIVATSGVLRSGNAERTQ